VFPTHVVCEWLGNTESVAREHYLRVTEDHFQDAINGALQNALQQPAVLHGTQPQTTSTTTRDTPVLQECASESDLLPFDQYTRRDSNPRPTV
jgi:hypothetical protein